MSGRCLDSDISDCVMLTIPQPDDRAGRVWNSSNQARTPVYGCKTFLSAKVIITFRNCIWFHKTNKCSCSFPGISNSVILRRTRMIMQLGLFLHSDALCPISPQQKQVPLLSTDDVQLYLE